MKEFQPHLILEATNVAILCTDRQGRILYVNDAAADTLGMEKAKLAGRSIGDVSKGAADAFREIIRTGKPQAGVKIETSGGTVIADRNPVFADGKVVGVVSVFKDISRYEETAKELQTYRALAKKLDAVINSSYDGLYITNGNADTLMYNKAYLRVSGLSASDVEGKNMRELVRAGTINRSVSLEVLRERRHVTIMQEFSNGRTAIVTGNPVFDEDGRIILVVTNVRDITELNELREQLEGSRTLAKRYRDELSKAVLSGVDRKAVVFRSPGMENCVRLALRVADVASPVLVTGESGVGKGMLARIIHSHGVRRKGPFIQVNCGAIPAGLMESELFGYQKGAFTSASEEGKPGLFEMADKGTIFLDEIGEVPQALQVKLLEALESGEVRRVGGTRSRRIDVRVVAATNRNLQDRIRSGQFREDLFFRLNVFPIHIPPLRERPEDILPLVDRTLSDLNRRYKKSKRIAPEALDLLSAHPFPGNVRELQNAVERAFILADGKVIERKHFPAEIQGAGGDGGAGPRVPAGEGIEEIVRRFERRLLEKSWLEHRNTYAMARALKVNQSTVVRKMKKLGVGSPSRPNAKSH